MIRIAFLLLVAFTLLVSEAGGSSRGKVLVLFEDVQYASSYGQYLQHIKRLGYAVEERNVADTRLQLRSWDDWLYDKLIIFASGISNFGGALDVEAILDFVDAGNDLILAVDSRVSEELRNLASDLGVDFEPRGSAVLDFSNYVTTQHNFDPSLIVSDAVTDVSAIIGASSVKGPILFKGVGATFSPENEQVLQVLGGKKTQLMANPHKGFREKSQLGGKAISLVAVAQVLTLMQTRSDARVAIAGSMHMFTSEFLQAKDITTNKGESFLKSGNEEFLAELTKWVFHEKSVLKASNLRHHPPGSLVQPDRYRITDELVFEIDIHEFSEGGWKPYNASDVQLEFVMLDPYIRTFLEHDGTGRFFAEFKIPDVYGVFKFVINYQRPGLTALELSQQISVRHFRHNEFERFIPAAYPYYASAFSSMIAFLIFGFVFLYHRDKK